MLVTEELTLDSFCMEGGGMGPLRGVEGSISLFCLRTFALAVLSASHSSTALHSQGSCSSSGSQFTCPLSERAALTTPP